MTHDEIVRELRIAADQLDFIPPTSDCAPLREIIPRLRVAADTLEAAHKPPAAAQGPTLGELADMVRKLLTINDATPHGYDAVSWAARDLLARHDAATRDEGGKA